MESKNTCCKKIQHSFPGIGKTHTSICGKNAEYQKSGYWFCRHHAKVKRFVLRDGNVGEILARYDTENELKDNAHLFPDAVLQKITKSARKDIFRLTKSGESL